jgi:four helix bundle protein
MRNFRDFEIWKLGVDLAVSAYRITSKLPKEEEYGLKSQIKRASVSIPSNIAEGCSRSSEKEFRRFLEISLGSSFEVETDLLLAAKLEFITIEDLAPFFEALQRQINSLVSKLAKGQRPTAKG